MSAAKEIQALKEELAQLKIALDAFFGTFPRDEYNAWKRAKSGAADTRTDTTTVGRNLPAVPVRTELLNIGGATI